MRTRTLTIILVGMTIGFLLALGVVSSLRGALGDGDPKLSITFTVFVFVMAMILLWYVVKTTP